MIFFSPWPPAWKMHGFCWFFAAVGSRFFVFSGFHGVFHIWIGFFMGDVWVFFWVFRNTALDLAKWVVKKGPCGNRSKIPGT